jgi:hypothetical protein
MIRQTLGAFSEYEKTMIVLKLRVARQRQCLRIVFPDSFTR